MTASLLVSGKAPKARPEGRRQADQGVDLVSGGNVTRFAQPEQAQRESRSVRDTQVQLHGADQEEEGQGVAIVSAFKARRLR